MAKVYTAEVIAYLEQVHQRAEKLGRFLHPDVARDLVMNRFHISKKDATRLTSEFLSQYPMGIYPNPGVKLKRRYYPKEYWIGLKPGVPRRISYTLSTGIVVDHPKFLDDRQLWHLVQTPMESGMPEDIKEYLKMAKEEFSKRKTRLVPIMNPGRKPALGALLLLSGLGLIGYGIYDYITKPTQTGPKQITE
ncbi:MAG: hypothetical protein V1701_02995 [Planctomycetota bacterium]